MQNFYKKYIFITLRQKFCNNVTELLRDIVNILCELRQYLTADIVVIGHGYLLHVGTYIEPCLCALVICRILERNAQAVYTVVHEGIETVLGRISRCIYAQLRIVLVPPNGLLAPVAQNIRLDTGHALFPVV